MAQSLTSLPSKYKIGTDVKYSNISESINRYGNLQSRLDIAASVNLFHSDFLYDTDDLKWLASTTAPATVGTAINSNVQLNATGPTGIVIRQTKQYIPYISGKTQSFKLAGILVGSVFVDGCISCIGSFDDIANKGSGTAPDVNEGSGHFFTAERVSGTTTISVVQRSTITGSQVDTKVAQSNWNLDKLNGSGDTKYVADFTKANVFVIERSWLGVGTVRLGIIVGAYIIWCHAFVNDNQSSTGTYMARASLPIRYELRNTGAVTSANITQLCSEASTEGDSNEIYGSPFSMGMNRSIALPVNTTTTERIYFGLSINNLRPRTYVRFKSIDCASLNGTATITTVKIILNPGIATQTIANIDSQSAMGYFYSSGGILPVNGTNTCIIKTAILGVSGDPVFITDLNSIIMGSSFSGATTTNDYLCVSFQVNTGTSTTMIQFNWEEIY
jgi:hypothetical protein